MDKIGIYWTAATAFRIKCTFTINGKNLTNDFQILSNAYKLPKIKGVRSSFTDAILVEGFIFFTQPKTRNQLMTMVKY
jgi:hypothetical protein